MHFYHVFIVYVETLQDGPRKKKKRLWNKGTGQWLSHRCDFRSVDFARILERPLNYLNGT